MVIEQREFDPIEFMRLAESLATEDADEATLRTAVGRLYYAVFLLARAKAGLDGQRQIHERVRIFFSAHNRSFASQLGTLGHLRNVADYETYPIAVQDRDWRNNWDIARRNANRVLCNLASLPNLTPFDSEDQSRSRQ